MKDSMPTDRRVTVLPVSGTTWGLPGALSVIMMDARRTPGFVGLKVTVIVHWAPGTNVVTQVLVCAKLAASGPVIATVVMVCGLSPFVIVTVRGWWSCRCSGSGKRGPKDKQGLPRVC